MGKNTKPLTTEELEILNNYYTFKYDSEEDGIKVKCNNYAKHNYVVHTNRQPFALNHPARKITLTRKAIDLWIDKYRDKYSLLDVQNAINVLTVTYAECTDEEIDNLLQNGKQSINIK